MVLSSSAFASTMAAFSFQSSYLLYPAKSSNQIQLPSLHSANTRRKSICEHHSLPCHIPLTNGTNSDDYRYEGNLFLSSEIVSTFFGITRFLITSSNHTFAMASSSLVKLFLSSTSSPALSSFCYHCRLSKIKIMIVLG